MSAQEIIEEFKALPPAERAQVTKFVVEHDDSWFPKSFDRSVTGANDVLRELDAMAGDAQIQCELRSNN